MGVTVQTDFAESVRYLEERLGVGRSYDIIARPLRIADTRLVAFVVNGFFQDMMILQTLASVEWLEGGEPAAAVAKAVEHRLPFVQVSTTDDLDEAADQVLAGPMVILVEGGDRAVVVDTRYYPDRMPNEPTTEQLVRGPHDGFIETLLFNTALVRRRIRDPHLRFELIQVGRRSKTDVALAYIEGLTNPDLVDELRRRLKVIDVDGIPMAEEAVAEFICRKSPWNPLPTVRFTERPDVAALHLLEGHALVMVDTTPEAIIAPSTFFNHLHHPEDYHVNPLVGTYLRWVVFAAIAISVLLPPAWLLLATNPVLLAHLPALKFLGPKKLSGFSLPLQFIMAEVAVDILRRAVLNTPHPMAAAMGILGAVVLGSAVSKTGLFSPEVVVYTVVAALGNFATSTTELGLANRLARLSLIVLVWVGGWIGGAAGLIFWLALALRTRSFGVPWLWPLIPFDWGALRSILVRRPVTARDKRPLALRPLDPTRRP